MRILVISDTHIPVAGKSLPEVIKEEAKNSNCCIHSGDIIDSEVLRELSKHTKLHAVCGNMDYPELKKKLPSKLILTFDNITIGLTHGGGPPSGLIEYVKREFAENIDQINIFIFGHSHIPFNQEIDGKVFFNAGSPTDTMFAPYKSYGILEINGSSLTRRIIKIE
jgi:hypothetical protein